MRIGGTGALFMGAWEESLHEKEIERIVKFIIHCLQGNVAIESWKSLPWFIHFNKKFGEEIKRAYKINLALFTFWLKV